MSEVTVILLGHKSLAGKDTFFDAVQGLGFVRVGFADKLKQTVADLYGFTNDQMFGNSKDIEDKRYLNDYDPTHFYNNDFGDQIPIRYFGDSESAKAEDLSVNPDYRGYLTPRRVLQIFGQQQRALFPDIWAAYVFNTALPKLVAEGHKKIVITDFRFQNEGRVAENWVKEDENSRSLYTVKVHRPDVYAKSGSNDISEVDLDNYEFDNTVINDGSLEEFQEKAREFVVNL